MGQERAGVVMQAKFKTGLTESEALADQAHLDKLSAADGVRFPRTPADITRGRRCTKAVLPDERVCRQHRCPIFKHPDKDEWFLLVNDFAAAQQGKVDPATLHTLDVSAAAAELPEDWSPEAVALEPIP